jgi:nucleotide-binding universal stress UspA family protein/predicted transcriptional regulator
MDWGTVLVPLDGSPLAEEAVPYAAAIAKATGAPVLVLSVVEREPRGLTHRSEQRAAQKESAHGEARRQYLAGIAAELQAQGLAVTTEVAVGDPVTLILAAASRDVVSMVVMTTHARGAVGRWLLGSAADAVVRWGQRPTLLLHPPYVRLPRRRVTLERLLVPLDGSPLAEAALPLAQDLAAAAGATLSLVRVEPWITRLGETPWATPDLVQEEEQAAATASAYLAEVRRRLPESAKVETVVLRGSPAPSLVEFVRYEHVDLVVMSTHGWSGLHRLLLGSTAEHLVRSSVPTVLVRPAASAASVQAPEAAAISRGAAATVRDIMNVPVVVVREDATLEEVARTLLEHHIGAVPVVDAQGRLRGIITESDFTAKERGLPFSAFRAPQLFGEWVSPSAIARIYQAARDRQARSIMTSPVVTATEDESIADLVQKLLRHDIARVPVVRDGVPVGMVARHDLLKLLVTDGVRP